MPNRPKSYDDTRESGLAGGLACFDGLHGDCLRLPSGHSLQLPKRIKRSSSMSSQRSVVFAEPVRTAIGAFGGAFNTTLKISFVHILG